jgi:hypothetical protein
MAGDRLGLDMSTTVEILRDIFELQVDHPFEVAVAGTTHRLQYLIKGSGEGLGLIVDKDWSKLEPIADALSELGYGCECFDLATGEFDEFSEILKEHGIGHV